MLFEERRMCPYFNESWSIPILLLGPEYADEPQLHGAKLLSFRGRKQKFLKLKGMRGQGRGRG